jgi:hypothetical protein
VGDYDDGCVQDRSRAWLQRGQQCSGSQPSMAAAMDANKTSQPTTAATGTQTTPRPTFSLIFLRSDFRFAMMIARRVLDGLEWTDRSLLIDVRSEADSRALSKAPSLQIHFSLFEKKGHLSA